MKYFVLLFFEIFIFEMIAAQDAMVVYKNSVNSTVTIETNLGLGSGFFIEESVLVTNYHVVEGASEIYFYTSNSATKYEIVGFVAVDRSNDLILLKTKNISRSPIKIYHGSIAPGQKILVLGSPKGLPATISDGIISGIRDFEGTHLLQITAPISPGSSGGPVLNFNGELIGISVGQFEEGQNLNFAIPSSVLEKVLESKTNAPKPFTSLFNQTGTYLDKRDGKTYKTIKIGDQLWLAENLNLLTPNGSYCYDNDPLNCSKFGRLYNWENAKNVCPTYDGWQLPTDKDWNALIDYLGGQKNAEPKLKSKSGWNQPNGSNNNESGFSGLPSGYYNPGCAYGSSFSKLGDAGYFWSIPGESNISADSTIEYDAREDWALLLDNKIGFVGMSRHVSPTSYYFPFDPKTFYLCEGMSYSVRCINKINK